MSSNEAATGARPIAEAPPAHGPTPVRLLDPDGSIVPGPAADELMPIIDSLSDDTLRRFHRDMVVTRRIDDEGANLQRQGQLALWIPIRGQEASQVGLVHASRPQDHFFPSYREHAVGFARGVDPVDIIRMLRGVTHGGWDPATHGNFHLYTIVLGSQVLHATGYAMGLRYDGECGTGDPARDAAVVAFYGDGASSQGDVSEAMVFAASFQTPEVFFLQNNHWAISVPVETQSRSPLYLRGEGFGIPSTQIDGNDVLASYAVSLRDLDAARSGGGPRLIEALTYRIGAHTTSDDPTKYRTQAELETWIARDPIDRFERYLRSRGESDAFFAETDAEARDIADDMRRRTIALEKPEVGVMFDHVYSEPHPRIDEQRAWFAQYEASFGDRS